MAKKGGVSKRLALEIALAKRIKKARAESAKKVPEATQERPVGLGSPFALLDESQPDGTSRWCLVPEYLQLEENAIWDRPILKAFKALDLDPCYLSEWRQLLFHLAYVLFPEPGAPQKWTDERLCRLLADVAVLKRKHPKAPDTAICKWLEKKWPNKSVRLRRILQNARNPKHNTELARVVSILQRRLGPDVTVSWVIARADELWAR